MIEVQNENGEKYGTGRLLDLLSSTGNDASEVIKNISQSVNGFAGKGSVEADIAVAILEYTPENS